MPAQTVTEDEAKLIVAWILDYTASEETAQNYVLIGEDEQEAQFETFTNEYNENKEAAVGRGEFCSSCHLAEGDTRTCLLYTSPSPRDATLSRMPSSA